MSKVRKYAVSICDQCIRVEGEMCHNPGCAFCRKTTEEIKGLLEDCQIKFFMDGEVIDLSESSRLPDTDEAVVLRRALENVAISHDYTHDAVKDAIDQARRELESEVKP